MNPLLQNEEVRRLFVCDKPCRYDQDGCISKNILDGTYANINKYDSYFELPQNLTYQSNLDGLYTGYHPFHIRLPDWQQQSKHEHKFKCECGEMK